MSGKENGVARILLNIGVFEIIAGLILGFIFANKDEPSLYSGSDEFYWSVAFTWWIGSFVSGMLVIGFAEVIELLDTKLSLATKHLEQIKHRQERMDVQNSK